MKNANYTKEKKRVLSLHNCELNTFPNWVFFAQPLIKNTTQHFAVPKNGHHSGFPYPAKRCCRLPESSSRPSHSFSITQQESEKRAHTGSTAHAEPGSQTYPPRFKSDASEFFSCCQQPTQTTRPQTHQKEMRDIPASEQAMSWKSCFSDHTAAGERREADVRSIKWARRKLA